MLPSVFAGIHRIPGDEHYRMYVTRQGKPVRLIVTWSCLASDVCRYLRRGLSILYWNWHAAP